MSSAAFPRSGYRLHPAGADDDPERTGGHDRVGPDRPAQRFRASAAGKHRAMSQDEIRPGPHVEEKIGPSDRAGRPQPDAPEVESARLLANDARDALRVRGFDDEEVRRLADEYVALDLGEDTDAFILWAVEHRREAH
jgi:hypothetical protein